MPLLERPNAATTFVTLSLDAFFSPHFTLLREWQPPATYSGREGRETFRLLQLDS